MLHHFQPLLYLLMCRWIKLESKRVLILSLFLFIALFFIFYLLLFLSYFMSLSFFFFFSALSLSPSLSLSLSLPQVPVFISFSFPVLLQNTVPFPDLLHGYVPVLVCLNPRSLEGEGGGDGGQIDSPSLNFFGFKFLLLDRLSNALVQLFLVCQHIF